MARRLSWSDVRGGVIATAAIVLLAFLTLKYSRLGALHGDTFRLTALVGEARGVLVGSEVWLSGQKIGKITSIRFRAPRQAGPDSRIEIQMDLLDRHRAALHKDAVAQIQNGGSFIGAPVVYLTPGSPQAREIRNGDTLKTNPQPDAETAAGQFAEASRQFPDIINNVKLIATQLESTKGTLGAIANSGNETRGTVMRARTQLMSGFRRVSASPNLDPARREELRASVNQALARVDSIRELIGSGQTSFGRFRSDSTLGASVNDVRNDVSLLRARAESARSAADSTLLPALRGAEQQMSDLMADMKKHPLRYVRF
jgi:ABC-type transporter Mla subunit MlaD